MPMPLIPSPNKSSPKAPGTLRQRSAYWSNLVRPAFQCSAVSHPAWFGGFHPMCCISFRRLTVMPWRARCFSHVEGCSPTKPGWQRRVHKMLTEQISPRFVDLDSWPTSDMIQAMYDGQLVACAAVRPALPAINDAVEDAVSALKRGGRLVYAGAGTSGRIAVQDGAELGPTYDWPSDRTVFVMAGGMQAVLQSVEGAEDNEAKGADAIADAGVNQNDVVIAVAASGTTPFTIGALRAAAQRQAVSIAVANNRGAPLFEPARHRILIETGTEVLAGSTRMQAGTAQKIVLNLFSTAVMVKLGRVYRGLMVSMRASNTKLLRRAEMIVTQIVGCDEKEAAKFVQLADGDIKV